MKKEVLDRAFWGLLSFVLTYGVYNLKEMADSVSELNIKIATVIERVEGHEKRIFNLEAVK